MKHTGIGAKKEITLREQRERIRQRQAARVKDAIIEPSDF
jgi:hypothetical protein